MNTSNNKIIDLYSLKNNFKTILTQLNLYFTFATRERVQRSQCLMISAIVSKDTQGKGENL